MAKRNYMKLNKSLCVAFGKKTHEDELTSNVFRIAPALELIMQNYIDGRYELLLAGKKGKIFAPVHVDPITSGVDSLLRDKFAGMAWVGQMIEKPSKAYILVEYLMRMYVQGNIELKKR